MNKWNIFYVYNVRSTWTAHDKAILERLGYVNEAFLDSWMRTLAAMNPRALLGQDAVIFWFASLRFFPAVLMAWLLGRRIIVISGGFDVAKVPDIGYGAGCDPVPLRSLRRLIFLMASKVCCMSENAKKEAMANFGVKERKISVSYLGFSKPLPELKPWASRKKQVVTIAGVNSETYLRKGIREYLALAKLTPDWTFALVGRIHESMEQVLRVEAPSNVVMTGFLSDQDRDSLLNDSMYYVQLSRHEGFGASVVDAALMGCCPIVFPGGALPEIVSEFGFVAESGGLSEVKSVLAEEAQDRGDVEFRRAFVLEKFSRVKREEHFLALLRGDG